MKTKEEIEHRKARLDLYTDEELAIYKVIGLVEELGADVLLTDCVVLLGDAKTKLQDWLEQEWRL
jgi:hypothetical protein